MVPNIIRVPTCSIKYCCKELDQVQHNQAGVIEQMTAVQSDVLQMKAASATISESVARLVQVGALSDATQANIRSKQLGQGKRGAGKTYRQHAPKHVSIPSALGRLVMVGCWSIGGRWVVD